MDDRSQACQKTGCREDCVGEEEREEKEEEWEGGIYVQAARLGEIAGRGLAPLA